MRLKYEGLTPTERENFRQLEEAAREDRLFSGFQVIDFTVGQAATNLKVAHGLGYAPLDCLITYESPTGVFTLNRDKIDALYLDITTTGAVRIRLLAGTFGAGSKG